MTITTISATSIPLGKDADLLRLTPADNLVCILAKGATFVGTITLDEGVGMVIAGTLQGDFIGPSSTVVVSETGHVFGRIHADKINIAGKVSKAPSTEHVPDEPQLLAESHINIGPDAVVSVGHVRYGINMRHIDDHEGGRYPDVEMASLGKIRKAKRQSVAEVDPLVHSKTAEGTSALMQARRAAAAVNSLAELTFATPVPAHEIDASPVFAHEVDLEVTP